MQICYYHSLCSNWSHFEIQWIILSEIFQRRKVIFPPRLKSLEVLFSSHVILTRYCTVCSRFPPHSPLRKFALKSLHKERKSLNLKIVFVVRVIHLFSCLKWMKKHSLLRVLFNIINFNSLLRFTLCTPSMTTEALFTWRGKKTIALFPLRKVRVSCSCIVPRRKLWSCQQ